MKSQYRHWWAALVAVALTVLACGGGGLEATATPFPRPTQKPQVSATPRPTRAPTEEPDADPTEAPDGEPTEVVLGGDVPFTLMEEPYEHPSGAFSLLLPEGWELDEHDDSVFASSPDGVSAIEISFHNVVFPLDEAGLDTFIQAVETNWFGSFADYEQAGVEPQSDGSIGVLKSLSLSDGTPQTVFSYYWQQDNIVFEQDFWVEADAYDAYLEGLLEIANSMTTDPAAAADIEPYGITYTFTGPNDLFAFSVPYGWTHTTDEAEDTVLDVFTSPDGLAAVDSAVYDDGETRTIEDARAWAVGVLGEFYQLEEADITGEEEQQDGSVRLDWTTEAGMSGSTFYEARDTALLLLTWAAQDDVYDTYLPVWSTVLDTYGPPPEE